MPTSAAIALIETVSDISLGAVNFDATMRAMKRVKSNWLNWQGKRFHVGFKTNGNHCWKWQLLKYDYPKNTLYRFWRFFLIRYKMIGPVTTLGSFLSEEPLNLSPFLL